MGLIILSDYLPGVFTTVKNIYYLLIVTNLLVDLLVYALLPDSVATHFAAGGTPNGWFTARGNLCFSLSLQTLFIGVVFAMRTALLHTPRQLVNLPNKDYWFADRHRAEFNRRWERLAYQFGCSLMAFFLCMSLIVTAANFANPPHLDTTLFVTVLACFLASIVYWIFCIYRTLRIPPATGSGT